MTFCYNVDQSNAKVKISSSAPKEKKRKGRRQEEDLPWILDDGYLSSSDESSEDDEDAEMEEKAEAALTALKNAGFQVTKKLLQAMLDIEEEKEDL